MLHFILARIVNAHLPDQLFRPQPSTLFALVKNKLFDTLGINLTFEFVFRGWLEWLHYCPLYLKKDNKKKLLKLVPVYV